MALAPIDVQKARFASKLKGYDPAEVESFLALVADELTAQAAEIERLQRENRFFTERLRETEEREKLLQATLVRGQRLADETIARSEREAQLLLKEAELAADKLTQQALEQVSRLETKIEELRFQRKEMRLRLKNTLEMYRELFEADILDEERTPSLHALPRTRRQQGQGRDAG